MKKVLFSSVIIVSFIAYAIINGKSQELAEKPKDIMVTSPTPKSSISISSAPIVTSVSVQPTQSTSSMYKDGEYTGEAGDAFYGNVQVKAIISGGKLSDIQILQYPNDHERSIEINQRALPILRQEAIQAQNAQVDIVSRATDSSNAFIQSLTSALQQAQS